MATSGFYKTPVAINSNMFLYLSWSRVGINEDAGTVTYNVNAHMGGDTNMIYRCYSSDYIQLYYDNAWHTVFSNWYPRGTGSFSDPKYGYISVENDVPSYIDATKWIDNWEGGACYVHCQGNLFNTNITFKIKDSGDASFKFKASLTGYQNRTWVIPETTADTNIIEVYSKIPYKDGSWNYNGRVWHKESGVWRKRKLFKRENGNWVKK